MIINFYSSPTFDRKYKRFSKKFSSFDADFNMFTDKIETLPYTDLGHNIRKYRLSVKSKGKGKRGGMRIVTLDIIVSENERNITFVMIFDKSEDSSITIARLISIIESEL